MRTPPIESPPMIATEFQATGAQAAITLIDQRAVKRPNRYNPGTLTAHEHAAVTSLQIIVRSFHEVLRITPEQYRTARTHAANVKIQI